MASVFRSNLSSKRLVTSANARRVSLACFAKAALVCSACVAKAARVSSACLAKTALVASSVPLHDVLQVVAGGLQPMGQSLGAARLVGRVLVLRSVVQVIEPPRHGAAPSGGRPRTVLGLLREPWPGLASGSRAPPPCMENVLQAALQLRQCVGALEEVAREMRGGQCRRRLASCLGYTGGEVAAAVRGGQRWRRQPAARNARRNGRASGTVCECGPSGREGRRELEVSDAKMATF